MPDVTETRLRKALAVDLLKWLNIYVPTCGDYECSYCGVDTPEARDSGREHLEDCPAYHAYDLLAKIDAEEGTPDA